LPDPQVHDTVSAVFIAGTGTFAAEIADWARAAGLSVAGLVELFDDSNIGATRHGLDVSGPRLDRAGARIGLGFGGSRRAGWEVLSGLGWSPAGVVHPAAVLAADVQLGDGATIGPLAVVGAASVIGAHALVSRGALVGHHVDVGAFSVLNPGTNIGGNSTIGEDVFVGIGATVVNGCSIGPRSVVAAGAVVLDDVAADTRVQGLPARPFDPGPA
jgi:sugar O-acyltransferase (sialic acid O-acetyltransferase NeuD family)